MNRERAKELLPIIQAFAEGKPIQFRLLTTKEWLDLPENEELTMTFPAIDYEYRIKPEPREFWIIEDGDRTLKAAHTYGAATNYSGEIIRVREVIE